MSELEQLLLERSAVDPAPPTPKARLSPAWERWLTAQKMNHDVREGKSPLLTRLTSKL